MGGAKICLWRERWCCRSADAAASLTSAQSQILSRSHGRWEPLKVHKRIWTARYTSAANFVLLTDCWWNFSLRGSDLRPALPAGSRSVSGFSQIFLPCKDSLVRQGDNAPVASLPPLFNRVSVCRQSAQPTGASLQDKRLGSERSPPADPMCRW